MYMCVPQVLHAVYMIAMTFFFKYAGKHVLGAAERVEFAQFNNIV